MSANANNFGQVHATTPKRSDLFAINSWNGREAIRLSNGRVELIALIGGGHLAVFRFLDQTGLPSQNVFWEAPWKTLEPSDQWTEQMSQMYGSSVAGRFLASFTGHALCLDYFGEPAPHDVDAGLSLHGEAAIRRWKALPRERRAETEGLLFVELPVSKLRFERMIRLDAVESVVFVEETVYNDHSIDHSCDWVQHVTFGPPFLHKNESVLRASGTLGVTSSGGAEGGSLLSNGRDFIWPFAPHVSRAGEKVDLRMPFAVTGHGFLAGVKLDPERDIEFLLAMNTRLRLGVGYCFRRKDFPFLTIWEENCGRRSAPWNGTTQARGMEFGTNPLPTGRESASDVEALFGVSKRCIVPAHGSRVARYLMFLFCIPQGVTSLENVTIVNDTITIYDGDCEAAIGVTARGGTRFLNQ